MSRLARVIVKVALDDSVILQQEHESEDSVDNIQHEWVNWFIDSEKDDPFDIANLLMEILGHGSYGQLYAGLDEIISKYKKPKDCPFAIHVSVLDHEIELLTVKASLSKVYSFL